MDSLENGHIVDHKYRILTVLGEGGMGAVYRAQHLLTEQEVALKVLHGGMGQEKLARRFKTEVSIGSRVNHPGIPAVFDAGQEADTGRLYFAMELLEGQSLRDRMDAGADADEIVRWLRDTLLVMAAAHAEGVLHRDLKPENLFLEDTPAGQRLRVLDFGIARDLARPSRTTTGTAVGTAFYMAPEQATGKREITPKVDVWAVGVMLYEALAGVLPFDGPSAHAVVVEAVTEPHRPLGEHRPDLGKGWAALVDRCLNKQAELRPSSTEASEVLDKLLKDSGNLAPVFELDRRRERESADTASAIAAVDVAAVDAEAATEALVEPMAATEDAVAIGAADSATHLQVDELPTKRGWLAAAALLIVGGLGAAGAVALWPGTAEAPIDGAAAPDLGTAESLATEAEPSTAAPDAPTLASADPAPDPEQVADPEEAVQPATRPPRRGSGRPRQTRVLAGAAPTPPPTEDVALQAPRPTAPVTPEPASPPQAAAPETPPAQPAEPEPPQQGVIHRDFPQRPPSPIQRQFPSRRGE